MGNTSCNGTGNGTYSVHPHGCGEHKYSKPCNKYNRGSSPRMWGTLHLFLLTQHVKRFIPTDVGNTVYSFSDGSKSTVHPHGCGEHLSTNAHQVTPIGSSPLMWGTLAVTQTRGQSSAVHPHGCGEHSSIPSPSC